MAAYKTGAFLHSKYYTPFYKTPLQWIPRSKSGASKSRPCWAAHTRLGNVWEYLPPPPEAESKFQDRFGFKMTQASRLSSFAASPLCSFCFSCPFFFCWAFTKLHFHGRSFWESIKFSISENCEHLKYF